jgi:hypothetical protein
MDSRGCGVPPSMSSHPHLPYRDTKEVGAADFYLAINATFRFIRQRLGLEGLRRYWHELGTSYYHPVAKIWATGGLDAVASYWRDFFSAEPTAQVEVTQYADSVQLHVHRCPAIAHLRTTNREVEPAFCQHCYFVSEAIAKKAGLCIRVEGGNGSCHQRIFAPTTQTAAQDLEKIESCL